MATQTINLSLPKELVKQIDGAAKREYASRSEYIRRTLVSRLRAQDADAWELLASGALEVRERAAQAGYKTHGDFARAVKELRQESK